ncbi:flagellar protein [bacterium]|nr:flagellar protein [bacterium]MBU1637495.1 flagellar protein [bacterium]
MIDNISKLPPIPAARSVNPVARPEASSSVNPKTSGADFSDVLYQELKSPESLKFSAHAQNRLQSRQICLNDQQMDRLRQGVGQAEEKGSKDSLVLLDNLAFVVSVKNRTVVTALDNAVHSGHVFTQIDSTVFV